MKASPIAWLVAESIAFAFGRSIVSSSVVPRRSIRIPSMARP